MNINDISKLMNAQNEVDFATSIKDTRGYLTIDGNGNVKNVGRHWYNFFSKPSDRQKNMDTRNALINAFKNSGLNADIINKAIEELGAFDKDIITTPLSRRTVKQILVSIKENTCHLVSETNNTIYDGFLKYNENTIKPKMTSFGLVYAHEEGKIADGDIIESNFVKPIIKFVAERTSAATAGRIIYKDAKKISRQFIDSLIKDPYHGDDSKVIFGEKITIKVLHDLKDMLDAEVDRVIDELMQKHQTAMNDIMANRNISKDANKYPELDDNMSDSDISD